MLAAFLADSKDGCTGPMTVIPLDCRHGEALAEDANRAAVGRAIQDAVHELTFML